LARGSSSFAGSAAVLEARSRETSSARAACSVRARLCPPKLRAPLPKDAPASLGATDEPPAELPCSPLAELLARPSEDDCGEPGAEGSELLPRSSKDELLPASSLLWVSFEGDALG